MSRDDPRFTFCLLADTHINSGPELVTEDYLRGVNKRVEWVIDDIRRLRPSFVIHLGDIIQPVPGSPERARAISVAKRVMSGLTVPTYYLPGNHDIGDKPARWVRAPGVDAGNISAFEEDWGPSFQSFDCEGCHFVLLNSPVMNAIGSMDSPQRSWLQRDLQQHRDQRMFFFSHYMPYLNRPDEEENYEAIDDPWRGDLLRIFREFSVEAIFSGHTHNLFVDRYGDTDLYTLPSTSFYRAEFNSLFVAEPATDDLGKLGYFEVAVYSDRHAARLIRLPVAGGTCDRVPPITMPGMRESSVAPMGIYADVALAQRVRLPASVAAKEFSRKIVRDDHLLWALKELPAGALRVPVRDLVDRDVLARLEHLADDGCRLHAFGFLGDCQRVLKTSGVLGRISGLEILSPGPNLENVMKEIRSWPVAADLPTYLAPIASWADEWHLEGTGRSVTVGLSPGDPRCEQISRIVAKMGFGLAFYVDEEEDVLDGFAKIDRCLGVPGIPSIVTVAVRSESELELCNRVAMLLVSAFARKNPKVFIEGITDWVWGRKKTPGLLDNRYNPRRAYFVYRHLHSILELFGTARITSIHNRPGEMQTLTLKNASDNESALYLPLRDDVIAVTKGKLIDLSSGSVLSRGCLRGPALEIRREPGAPCFRE